MRRADYWKLIDLVGQLEPLTPAEVYHFTRVSFRDSPAQPHGWVREYVPRLVRTLLDDVEVTDE